MKTWQATVVFTRTMSKVVTVEAESEVDAQQAAMEAANTDEGWEQDDSPLEVDYMEEAE